MLREDDFHNLVLHERKLYELMERLDFSSEDVALVSSAHEMAKDAHAGQERDGGGAYIIHPVRVANILMENLQIRDAHMICAALLHDVVEDSDITLNDIKTKFGDTIATLVDGVTRDKEGGETKAMETGKIVTGPMDIRLIKAADKLDNLRSYPMRTDRDDRWKRHLREARTLFPALARSTENDWLIKAMDEAYEAVPDKETEFES